MKFEFDTTTHGEYINVPDTERNQQEEAISRAEQRRAYLYSSLLNQHPCYALADNARSASHPPIQQALGFDTRDAYSAYMKERLWSKKTSRIESRKKKGSSPPPVSSCPKQEPPTKKGQKCLALAARNLFTTT